MREQIMLPTLLILSGALLGVAVALYRQHIWIIAIVLGLSACAVYPIVPDTARALILVYPILAVVWLQCRRRQASRATFAGCAAASLAAGWALTLGPFFPQWFEIQRLAAKYPEVRIDSRLSYERRAGFSVPGAVPENRDFELTSLINSECADRYWSLFALEELHNDFFYAFAAQDGFGGERMTFDPPQTELIEMPVDPGPLSIPFEIASETATSSGSDLLEPIRRDATLTFHREQIVNFANARGFGFPTDGKYVTEATPYEASGGHYVLRGVTRVRGFEPHAFRQLPQGSPVGVRWQLTRLELVSLLKHQPPAAYVSEHLPRMQELSSDDTPTRVLDPFEEDSLKRLLDGETIVAEQSRSRIRMFGGLRATFQCAQCHNVNEGHLLGAFSYEFMRKDQAPPQPNEQSQAPVI